MGPDDVRLTRQHAGVGQYAVPFEQTTEGLFDQTLLPLVADSVRSSTQQLRPREHQVEPGCLVDANMKDAPLELTRYLTKEFKPAARTPTTYSPACPRSAFLVATHSITVSVIGVAVFGVNALIPGVTHTRTGDDAFSKHRS